MATKEPGQRAARKFRTGTVVSNKMHQTIVVRVETTSKHPLYGKPVRSFKKLYAHDANNEVNIGDRVRITETRPLSKLKRWRLLEVVERAVE